MANENTDTIRRLNDIFRSTFAGGKVCTTPGIRSLPIPDQVAIFRQIRLFDQFTEANDPHGEHDFGRIEHAGSIVYFKIDYYAPNLRQGSEDPSDPRQTIRVMTIMLAQEY